MASPKPSRIAAALQYLQQMRDRAADFGGGVVDTLADRARDVGGLAYEALTSDPNIGRMTTAEFSQAADRPTPRLDAMGRGAVELGRAVLTQPVETGKAVVRGEIERARGAMENPRAMGQYAGEFVNPLRLAAALRRGPMLELDVYHGTPHRFEPTEANPLGELDASKIGTGEGAQAYGHGIYLAESPDVADTYRAMQSPMPRLYKNGVPFEAKTYAEMLAESRALGAGGVDKAIEKQVRRLALHDKNGKGMAALEATGRSIGEEGQILDALRIIKSQGYSIGAGGSLYTLDLPDEMIDRMLDWDKPLSEQSEAVRRVLMPMVMAKMKQRGTPPHALEYSANRALGGDIVKNLFVGNGVTSKDVSRMLQEAGIPGVRYFDAGSRGGDSATGTRNFVVFPGEEKKVKVLRRE